jgi:hypothetical protein
MNVAIYKVWALQYPPMLVWVDNRFPYVHFRRARKIQWKA